MTWVIVWIVGIIAACAIGNRKGRPGLGFLLGLLLGIIGAGIMVCVPKAAPKPLTAEQIAAAKYRADHVPASEEYRARKQREL